MGIFESSTVSLLCLSNLHCLQLVKDHMGNSVRETASFTLGLISVCAWVVAEIPQIITNHRAKSTEGLSITFLVTWMLGDFFNFFGCLLEPATLPTQLYTAVLYTIITTILGAQTIYYMYIYPQQKYKRQLKSEQVETSNTFGQCNSGVEKASDAEQGNGFGVSGRSTGVSSPISFQAHPSTIFTGGDLFYQSARYLSKSHTPTAGSILAQRTIPSSPVLDSIEENLLGSTAVTRSEPALKMKSTLCLVSTLTFIGGINLFQSLDRGTNPTISTPRQEFVMYVGRKLFQVGDDQLAENNSGIGTFLGWIMTFIYLGGRLPQICLNIRRGHAEGLNPLMFLFALIGNATYVASILLVSTEWSRIEPNLPWLVDAGGCVLLDWLILMQFLYFRFRTSPSVKEDLW